MSKAIPTLSDLAKEYRPSMDREILHSWAEDVVAALSAGQAKPVGYRWTFDASEPRKWYYADALPEEWRFGNPEKTEPVYAAPLAPPAVPGEVHAQLALIKHLAEYTTEKNWDDKRLYIMQAVDRALSVPLPEIEGGDKGDGWQLVPIEPTPEMLGAWYRYKNGHHWPDEPPPRDTSDYGAYRAMLAAAPSASIEGETP